VILEQIKKITLGFRKRAVNFYVHSLNRVGENLKTSLFILFLPDTYKPGENL